MEPEISSIKLYITELLLHSKLLVSLIYEAKKEALKPCNTKWLAGAEHWANQAVENISRYIETLEKASSDKNPKTLSHVAESFASLGRYIDDYNYQWFTKAKELDGILGLTCESGSKIYRLIDVFDVRNMELIKSLL